MIELRIGTKLAITAGLGVLLVAGMVMNSYLSGETVEHAVGAAARQQDVLASANKAEAQKAVDVAAQKVVHSENRERLRKIKTLLDSYTAAAGEVAAAQKQVFADIAKRTQITPEWDKGIETLLAS